MNQCKLNYKSCPKHTDTYYNNASLLYEALRNNITLTFVPNIHTYKNVTLVFEPVKTLIKPLSQIYTRTYPLCDMILLINNSLQT